MQDLTTGEMRPLPPELMKMVEEMEVKEQKPFWEKIGELDEKLQRAKDAAIPQRENQGPIFSVGEVLEIRGGKFRVHAITDKRIYLYSLPRDGAEAPASPEIYVESLRQIPAEKGNECTP
jgi:uncharacterized Zn finger protein